MGLRLIIYYSLTYIALINNPYLYLTPSISMPKKINVISERESYCLLNAVKLSFVPSVVQ